MEKEPKEEIRRELEQLSPLLSKLRQEKREAGFTVPKHYFHNLQVEVLQQIRKETPDSDSLAPKPTKNSWAWLLKPKFGLAAAALLTLLVTWFVFQQPQDTAPMADLQSLTDEEVQQYIQANLDEFDEALLAQYALETTKSDWSFLSDETLDPETVDELYEELIDELDLSTLEELL